MIQNLSNTTGTGINCGLAKTYNTQKFSISGWIRRMGTGTTVSGGTGGLTALEPIFTGGVGQSETIGQNAAWMVGYVPASGSIGCDFEDIANGGNHWITASNNSILNNTMSHFVVMYDNSSSLNTGSYYIYINGSLNATKLLTTSSHNVRTPDTTSTQGVGIGIAISTTRAQTGAFYGYITDIAIWNSILNQDQITQLYSAKKKGMPLQISPETLQGYWPLDDLGDNQGRPTSGVSASMIQDRSGRNNHGTPYLRISGSAENFLSY